MNDQSPYPLWSLHTHVQWCLTNNIQSSLTSTHMCTSSSFHVIDFTKAALWLCEHLCPIFPGFIVEMFRTTKGILSLRTQRENSHPLAVGKCSSWSSETVLAMEKV